MIPDPFKVDELCGRLLALEAEIAAVADDMERQRLRAWYEANGPQEFIRVDERVLGWAKRLRAALSAEGERP